MEDTFEVPAFDETWYSTADERQRTIFRKWLKGVLEMHENVSVTFKKKDGSIREMKCTLKEGIRPNVENPKNSNDICTVWDTELNAWRSFKFENITKINFEL